MGQSCGTMEMVATLRFAVQFPELTHEEHKRMAAVAVGLKGELAAYAKDRAHALKTHKTLAQYIGEQLVNELQRLYDLEDTVTEKSRSLPGPSFELLERRKTVRRELLDVARILAAPKNV